MLCVDEWWIACIHQRHLAGGQRLLDHLSLDAVTWRLCSRPCSRPFALSEAATASLAESAVAQAATVAKTATATQPKAATSTAWDATVPGRTATTTLRTDGGALTTISASPG